MADYEAEREEIQRRSPRSESESSRAFRRSVARWLDNAGHHRKAFRVRRCSPRKQGGLPCHERILCDHCRDVDTLKTKRDYTARVLSVMDDNPDTILLWATLTMGEAKDCKARVEDLHDLLAKLLERPEYAWGDVLGAFWFLHAVRAKNPRLWRPHYHLVLVVRAADFVGFENHHRRLATGWGRAAWAILHPTEPVPRTPKSEKAFRRFMANQSVVPLKSFGQSDLLSLRHSRHDMDHLRDDLFSLIEYAKERKEDDPDSNSARMRPRDYGHISQMSVNHRGLKGELYKVPGKVAQAGAKALAQLDPPIRAEQSREECLSGEGKGKRGQPANTSTPPTKDEPGSLRKQLHIDALRSPSNAASLIPRPESDFAESGRRIPEHPSIKRHRLRTLQRNVLAQRRRSPMLTEAC